MFEIDTHAEAHTVDDIAGKEVCQRERVHLWVGTMNRFEKVNKKSLRV